MISSVTNSSGNEFRVEYSPFEFCNEQRKRLVSISGSITQPEFRNPERIEFPMSLRSASGRVLDPRPLNTEHNCVIPMSFGGPNVRQNTVPMYAYFINGKWMELEEKIKSQYMEGLQQVHMTVNMKYHNDWTNSDPRIPYKFQVEFRASQNADLLGAPLNYHHVPPAIEYLSVDLIDLNLIEEFEFFVYAGNWSIESANPNLKVPEKGVSRPYDILDHMLMSYNKFGRIASDNGKAFTPYQRDLILWVNQVRNNGELRSDDESDLFYDRPLLSTSGMQSAQIQHIVPVNQGGSNSFSNAKVVSQYHLTNK